MLPLRNDAFCVHRVATARCAPISDDHKHRMVAFQTHAASQDEALCVVWRQLQAHPLVMFTDTAWWHFIHMLPLRDDALGVHRVATALCAPNTMFSDTAWWHFIHMLTLRDDALCVHRVATATCAPRNDVHGHRMVAFHTPADSQGRCTLRTPCGDS